MYMYIYVSTYSIYYVTYIVCIMYTYSIYYTQYVYAQVCILYNNICPTCSRLHCILHKTIGTSCDMETNYPIMKRDNPKQHVRIWIQLRYTVLSQRSQNHRNARILRGSIYK